MVEEETELPSTAKRIIAIRKAMGLNQTEFAKKIGVTQGNVSNYEKGKTEPGARIVRHLLEAYHVQQQWWATGVGDMFYQEPSTPDDQQQTQRSQLQVKQLLEQALDDYVPYYNIDVTSEQLENYFTTAKEIPEGYLYAPQYKGCIMVNMHGDSMSNRIQSGARLYVHPLPNLKYIDYGQIYLVVLDGFRLLKYIQQHPTDESKVVLSSHNKHYSDWAVNKSDIRSLFLVKGFEHQNSL